MIIIIALATMLLTAVINYSSVIAVSRYSSTNKTIRNVPSEVLWLLHEVLIKIKTERKWFLKKDFILSLIFAILSSAGVYLSVLFLSDTVAIIRYIIILIILSPVAIIDCYTRKIFNKITGTALVIRAIILIIEFFVCSKDFKNILISSLLGLVVGFLLLALLSAISRGGLGMGDVKIISVLGFYTGIATMFYSLVLGLFCCFFYCIYLILIKKKDKKYELPFGPFILIGLVLTLLVR